MAVAERIPTVQELSEDESRAYFDKQARRLLSMSGADFIKAWDGGAFPNPDDSPEVMQLVMLLPFVR